MPRKPKVIPNNALCECGDYRTAHKDNVGQCNICTWTNNLVERCTRFRYVEIIDG